jgi:hypothetical protein
VRWHIEEGVAGHRFRQDLPAEARRRLFAGIDSAGRRARQEAAARVRALWQASIGAVGRLPEAETPPQAPPLRLRDLFLDRTHIDLDDMVHPLLIRLSAAYLDQGVAYWPMPVGAATFREAVAEVYGERALSVGEPWSACFQSLLSADRAAGGDDLDSLIRSLEALAVPSGEWEGLLAETALALRGWAGMFHSIETRPDRVPVRAPAATLAGFLAVRLLLERSVAGWVAQREFGDADSLAATRERLRAGWQGPPPPSAAERAWPLFQVAQLAGLLAADLDALPATELADVAQFLETYGDVDQRRLLHLAYERSYYGPVLGALAAHQPEPAQSPVAQVVFCLDEREESIRRHLEEVHPGIETLGYAGYFGIAMYYRGMDDAHARPLCPIVIQPRHEVREYPAHDLQSHVFWRRLLHRRMAGQSRGMTGGGTTLVRGTLITALAGTLSAAPLLTRVLFPRVAASLHRRTQSLLRPRPSTRLAVDRVPGDEPSLGEWSGFSIDEMAGIVGATLQEMGIAGRLAPLVMVLGHGSTSLNNPHESAHDCGACGGGRGGANARAFAHMANEPGVRAFLGAMGTPIPAGVWFVGGEHNSCDDGIELFDLELAPDWARGRLAALAPALDQARARNAHERCRRYENFPGWLPEQMALAHVEARAHDLAQPRPEYGHATNAICVIGRRALTRGLFLDRRAFLVSYDATTDGDGTLLARLMAAAVPVVAGINLEYYFAVVDPAGYGCGTKLPHNVSGLLGVMDGHASDLRTGLPLQMAEIHDPVRLLIVVEASPQRVAAVLQQNASIERLARNRWLHLVALDPASGTMYEFEHPVFREFQPDPLALPTARSSRQWYAGEREHLPIALIAADKGAEA